MNDYDYEFEPSEADELFDEIKNKLIDRASQAIKDEISKLRERNKYLEDLTDKQQGQLTKYEQENRQREWTEERIRKEIERDYLNKKVIDIIRPFVESKELWAAIYQRVLGDKCDLCNENRELVHEFPNGVIAKAPCTCNKGEYLYCPEKVDVDAFRYKSTNSNRLTYVKIYFADECKIESRRVYSEFGDEIIAEADTKPRWMEYIFDNEDACKQYCDWLNEKRRMEKIT